MEYASLTLSIIAVILSIFTFYWTSLRVTCGLTLTKLNRTSEAADLVLVNTGNTEIRIAAVRLSFRFPNGSESFPDQAGAVPGDGVINPGSTTRVLMRLTESAISEIKRQALQETDTATIPLVAHINWIDGKGRDLGNSCEIAQYRFSEKLAGRVTAPGRKRQDLYVKAEPDKWIVG